MQDLKPILAGIFGTVVLLSAMSAIAAPTVRTNVSLAWNYPLNELTNVEAFHLYSSTNVALPLTQWPHYATIVRTNLNPTNLTVTLPIDYQQRYFVITASNSWWGESVFSNVADTPPLPRSDLDLKILQR